MVTIQSRTQQLITTILSITEGKRSGAGRTRAP